MALLSRKHPKPQLWRVCDIRHGDESYTYLKFSQYDLKHCGLDLDILRIVIVDEDGEKRELDVEDFVKLYRHEYIIGYPRRDFYLIPWNEGAFELQQHMSDPRYAEADPWEVKVKRYINNDGITLDVHFDKDTNMTCGHMPMTVPDLIMDTDSYDGMTLDKDKGIFTMNFRNMKVQYDVDDKFISKYMLCMIY